ncbi:MAG: Zn-ribbon domain-containing OB-fold protein [Nevskiales bacterium]
MSATPLSKPAATTRESVLPGWFTLDEREPHLLGTRCTICGTYYFPKQSTFCRNPDCASESFEEVKLSRIGKLWSFTNAAYQPPAPYIASEPFQPFGIAAVELQKERMIVLGQLASGVDLKTLKAGAQVELVLEPLDDGKLVWKWKPMQGKAS